MLEIVACCAFKGNLTRKCAPAPAPQNTKTYSKKFHACSSKNRCWKIQEEVKERKLRAPLSGLWDVYIPNDINQRLLEILTSRLVRLAWIGNNSKNKEEVLGGGGFGGGHIYSPSNNKLGNIASQSVT